MPGISTYISLFFRAATYAASVRDYKLEIFIQKLYFGCVLPFSGLLVLVLMLVLGTTRLRIFINSSIFDVFFRAASIAASVGDRNVRHIYPVAISLLCFVIFRAASIAASVGDRNVRHIYPVAISLLCFVIFRAASIAASVGGSQDSNKRHRLVIWPEWSDNDVNAEKWVSLHPLLSMINYD